MERGDRPGDDIGIHQEIAQRWDQQRGLDEAVAAIRGGDADDAIVLAESSTLQACFERNRSVFAALLALMIGSGDSVMLDYVRENCFLLQVSHGNATVVARCCMRPLPQAT